MAVGWKFYPCELRVAEHGFGGFCGFFRGKLTAVAWKFYPCELRVVGHGFTRILRIGSWGNILPFRGLHGQNPRNLRKSA
ncbi:MAG: hypothetical protein FWG87_03995 [Defluviitaleaceae bacterium]|nr:hypothetical protein [Defluviitaleaceae bacterium]